MTEDRDQLARWIEPTSIQGADLPPRRSSLPGAPFEHGSDTTPRGDQTELVELGILPADTAASSETAEE